MAYERVKIKERKDLTIYIDWSDLQAPVYFDLLGIDNICWLPCKTKDIPIDEKSLSEVIRKYLSEKYIK